MHVVCLHPSVDEVAAFEAAAPAGMFLSHHPEPRLARRARTMPGGVPAAELALRLGRLAPAADAVLVTDDLLEVPGGVAADAAGALLARAVARRAGGRSVEVLFTDPALEPLLARRWRRLPGAGLVRCTQVGGAARARAAGTAELHDALVGDAVRRSLAKIVVLAEPAMRGVPPVPGTELIAAAPAALAELARRSGLPLSGRGRGAFGT